MAIRKYPTSGIIQEMLESTAPELRGHRCDLVFSFARDIYRPYEEAVINIMATLKYGEGE